MAFNAFSSLFRSGAIVNSSAASPQRANLEDVRGLLGEVGEFQAGGGEEDLEDGEPVSVYVGKKRKQMPSSVKLILYYAPDTRYHLNQDASKNYSMELPDFEPQTFRLFRAWMTTKAMKISSKYPEGVVPHAEDLQKDVVQLCALALFANNFKVLDEFINKISEELKALFSIAHENGQRTPITQDALLQFKKLYKYDEEFPTRTLIREELTAAFVTSNPEQRATYEDFKKLFYLEAFRKSLFSGILVCCHEMAGIVAMSELRIAQLKRENDGLATRLIGGADDGDLV